MADLAQAISDAPTDPAQGARDVHWLRTLASAHIDPNHIHVNTAEQGSAPADVAATALSAGLVGAEGVL